MDLSNVERISPELRAGSFEFLYADNVDFPEGLSLYVENIDNKLVFNFESKKNMKHLIGTVDETPSIDAV